MSVLLVYMTAPDRQTARMLADTLVEERLCACANIVDGMESVYWWQGKVERASECVCVFKTSASVYPAMEKRAVALHPYDTPCIVAVPVSHGYGPFLDWAVASTGG